MGDLATSWHSRWLFARNFGLHCFPQCSMFRLLVSLGGCGSSSSGKPVDAGMNGAGGSAPPLAVFPHPVRFATKRFSGANPTLPVAATRRGSPCSTRRHGRSARGRWADSAVRLSLRLDQMHCRRLRLRILAGAAGLPFALMRRQTV